MLFLSPCAGLNGEGLGDGMRFRGELLQSAPILGGVRELYACDTNTRRCGIISPNMTNKRISIEVLNLMLSDFARQQQIYMSRPAETDLAREGNLLSREHRERMSQEFPVLYHACPVKHRDSIESGQIVLGFAGDYRRQEDTMEGVHVSTKKYSVEGYRDVVAQFCVEEDFYIFCLSKTKDIRSFRRAWSGCELDLYEVDTALFLPDFTRQARKAGLVASPQEKQKASQGKASCKVMCKSVNYYPRDEGGHILAKTAHFGKSDFWAQEREVRIAFDLFGDLIATQANGGEFRKTLRGVKVIMHIPPKCFKRI